MMISAVQRLKGVQQTAKSTARLTGGISWANPTVTNPVLVKPTAKSLSTCQHPSSRSPVVVVVAVAGAEGSQSLTNSLTQPHTQNTTSFNALHNNIKGRNNRLLPFSSSSSCSLPSSSCSPRHFSTALSSLSTSKSLFASGKQLKISSKFIQLSKRNYCSKHHSLFQAHQSDIHSMCYASEGASS